MCKNQYNRPTMYPNFSYKLFIYLHILRKSSEWTFTNTNIEFVFIHWFFLLFVSFTYVLFRIFIYLLPMQKTSIWNSQSSNCLWDFKAICINFYQLIIDQQYCLLLHFKTTISNIKIEETVKNSWFIDH